MASEPAEIEILLAELGRSCYAKGWVMGTSGNFSAVLDRDPFSLTITSTGLRQGDPRARAVRARRRRRNRDRGNRPPFR
jgi:ribulose-5-phosphate 4-epimerase/fuculose-1-phosphate aldolase